MRRHRKAGRPVQPRWETREFTTETVFCWICWHVAPPVLTK